MIKKDYEIAKKLNIDICDMTVTALAGYYVTEFPKDPVKQIQEDMRKLKIPSSTGLSAELTVLGYLKYKERVNDK